MWRRSFVAVRPSACSRCAIFCHPESIDQDVGGGVVAETHHQHRVVADRKRRRAEIRKHTGAAHGLRAIEHQRIFEADAAFLDLLEQLVDERQLDGGRRRQRRRLEMREPIAGRQVDDRVGHDAIETRRDLFGVVGELLFQFVSGGLRRRTRHSTWHPGTWHHGTQHRST